MKKLLYCFFVIIFSGCASSPVTLTVDPKFSHASDLTIAILPTRASGNPDKLFDKGLTEKFTIELRKLGFRVVDNTFVNAWFSENNIDFHQILTLSQMKKIQNDLNASAILFTEINYQYIPGSEYSSSYEKKSEDTNVNVNVKPVGNSGIDWGGVDRTNNKTTSRSYFPTSSSRKVGAHYRSSSESLKMIDANNNIVFMSAYISNNGKIKSLSSEMISSIRKYLVYNGKNY